MTVNDMTDAFDRRLQAMQRAQGPSREQDVAIAVYERLRTARSIAESLLTKASNADVIAVFTAINGLEGDRNFRGLVPHIGTSTTDDDPA